MKPTATQVSASSPTEQPLEEIWEADIPGTLHGIGPESAQATADMLQGILKPGTTFGVYIVGECIGEGGMARIYRAEHAGLKRHVALKVLTNGFARDADGRERFVREARIAAAIKHPNVVNIFDVGVHQNIPYLVMELLEGIDLEALLVQKKKLDEGTLIDIMVPVIAGLTAVHDAGVVHRDLKPGNIFLARGRYADFEPKLLDFGISKSTGHDHFKLTSGAMMGTPFYVSPEALSGQPITPKSDQYSLGVVMYECATGHTPFNASTLPELTRLITQGKYTPSQAENPRLSRRLASIITRAMSVSPDGRYQDMREMGRDLLSLAGQRTRITWGLSFGELAKERAAAAEAPSVPPPATGSHRLRNTLLILSPIALLIVLLIAFQRTGPQTPPGPSEAPETLKTTTNALSVAPSAATTPPVATALPTPIVVPVAPPPARSASSAAPRSNGSHSAARARPSARQPSAPADTDALTAKPRPQSGARPNDSVATRSGSNGAPILD